MNVFSRFLPFIFIALATLQTLSAQWLDGGAKQSTATRGSGALHVHKETMFLYNEEHGMMQSTNWGEQWVDIEDVGLPPVGPGIAKSVTAFATVGNRLYACMSFGNGTGMVFYSTNVGNSWSMDTLGAPGQPLGWGGLPTMGTNVCGWGDWLFIHFGGVKNFYIKHRDSAFRKSAYMSENVNNPRSVVAKGDTLFASSVNFYYTTDGGNSWVQPQSVGYPSAGWGGKLTVDGSRIYLIAPKVFGKAAAIFYTDDNGNNWKEIDISSLTNQKGTNTVLYDAGAIFVKGNNIHLTFTNGYHVAYKSTNLGTTWTIDTAGLTTTASIPFASITGFVYTPANGMLWCALSHENIYKQKISEETTSAVLEELHYDVSIYPNPCHNRFTVSVRENNYNSYELRDNMGRTVLAKSVDTASSEVDIDVSGMACGYYWLVLKSNTDRNSVQPVVID